MPLVLYRRHTAACCKDRKIKPWNRSYRKCRCPIHAEGTLRIDGFVRVATKETVWEKAEALKRAWEEQGAQVAPQPIVVTAGPNDPTDEHVTVAAAVEAYLADARDRGNSESAIYKKEGIFARQFRVNPKTPQGEKIPAKTNSLLRFCDRKGLRFVDELTLPVISEWRATWNVNSLVRAKRQGQVIGFFWFCERRSWFPRNYAADITTGLGKIDVKPTQTGYFVKEQYDAIIDATYVYSDRPSVDKHNSLTVGGHRIRALTELMRWTGLRIRDAVTLERRRVTFDPGTQLWNVMVYQRKTGGPVYCPIPSHVAELLKAVPASQKGNTNEKYFFWTGAGTPKSITSNWQRSYAKLFKLAAIKHPDGTPVRCHPHMFRDTFAVESLLADMPVQRVSEILGHSSIKVTEKHYLPWVRARQEHLNDAVVASWRKQGVLGGENKRKPGRAAAVVQLRPASNE